MQYTAQEKSFLGLSPKGFHRVLYSEWGDPKNRDVVVCVHGLTRNRHDFDFLAQHLAADYRVICPDIVGRGDSDYLQDPFLYSYPQYLSDMNALMARLNVDRVSWVGTSMGGLMGIMLASFPQTPIKKLILNDIGSVVSAEGLKRIATYAEIETAFKTAEEGHAYLLQHHLKFMGKIGEEPLKNLLTHSLKFNEAKKLWEVAYDTLAGHTFSKNEEYVDVDFSAYWNDIKCPVLLLRGALSDIISAETAKKMLQKKQVSFIELPGIGHPPSLSTPEQVGMIHEWLIA
jgi:pimeloyl-ACP methyl ester carboxylesterase